MITFEKSVTCVVCNKPGVAVYDQPTGLMQSLDCPDGCWSTPAGQLIIQKLNDAPRVIRP